MPLITTPAIVLKVTPYSETSRIVRLLTLDHGLLSALARGARRATSQVGAGLDLFAVGVAMVRTKAQTDLHTLSGFDLTRGFPHVVDDVARFGAASALAELALKCAPAEPHAEVFHALEDGLDALDRAAADVADAAALSSCWRLVVALGFEPTLDRCAVCGEPMEGAATFSAVQGGALCREHRGDAARHTTLQPADRDALRALLDGRWPDPPLDARHAAAHRRLLMTFIRHHLAEDRPFPALAFWDRESWTATGS
jgi:DNA repair protein RecO (recombination protein O)